MHLKLPLIRKQCHIQTYFDISGPQRPFQLHCSDGVDLVSLAQVIWTHLTQANILNLALIHKCLNKSHWHREWLTLACQGTGLLYKLQNQLLAILADQLNKGICSYAAAHA